ncbi:MAG: O-antigen ligase domain-containing protein [Deltaproteobacteria bacterium]|nr:MAG: O-antigen ligase domain-containing protein [Deltaproteobacteria bacterium]
MILRERLPFLLPAAPLVALLAFAPLLYLEPLWVVLAVPVLATLVLMAWNPTLSAPVLLAAVMISDGLEFGINVGVILSVGKLTVLGVLGATLAHGLLFRQHPLRPNLHWIPHLAMTLLFVVGFSRSQYFSSRDVQVVFGFLLLGVLTQLALNLPRETWIARVGPLLGLAYLVVAATGMLFGEIDEGYGVTRSAGFGGIATEWSFSLLLGLGPCAAMLQASSSRVLRAFAPMVVLVGSVAIAASVTRAAILLLVAISPILLWIVRKQIVAVLAGGAGVLIAAPAFVDVQGLLFRLNPLVEGHYFETDGSLRDRQIVAEHGWRIFTENPVFGTGTASFATEVHFSSGGQVSLVPHNAYLGILAEQGVVGFLITLLYLGYIGWHVLALLRADHSPRFRTVAVGLACAFLVFVLYALVFDALTYAPAYFWFGIIFLWYAESRKSTERLRELGMA